MIHIDTKRFIKHDNKLYILERIIREEHNPNIEVWKEFLGCDITLRKDGLLYFCALVPEIDDVEYISGEVITTLIIDTTSIVPAE